MNSPIVPWSALATLIISAAVPGVLAQRSGPLPAERAWAALQVAPGFQVELFAAEPMLMNPTSIDVDHRGRVWVAEAVNYRRYLHRQPLLRQDGDRIVVLLDTDGDGQADQAKTFYQGPDLIAPLSVCVIPQPDGKALRVLVAQSPDILEFWDKDGDLKADGPPTKFLTGFGGFDHDHGVHGLTIGPDNKLYFTVGDSGVGQGRDRDGKPIPPLQSRNGQGRKWVSNSTDCRAGTVWRCDLDGTNLELIAHNFRNNYEACVDSFGEIWLSDNDDDGNQQTRICFVLPGGNYGYHPRGPGQSHWHEEQPGIVHKVLRTGFGSPTGICFYEGKLFGPQYEGALLHCDAGPREVRAFFRKRKGAGYELEKEILLTSKDNWFRPSDVCVAPDGSIFVADWYDRGVGGHGMGDPFDGRIYRLTPKGHKGYTVPEVKLDTPEGVLAAFDSPNIAMRTLGTFHVVEWLKERDWRELRPGRATFACQGRLIHAAAQSPTGRINLLRTMMKFSDEEVLTVSEMEAILRTVANQLALRELGGIEFDEKSARILSEYKAGIRREYLLLAQYLNAEQCKPLFYALAEAYDGQDHFYRAALNIACGTDPARRDAILVDFDKHFPEWNDRVADLVWELRPKSMLPRLGKLLEDPKLTDPQKARVLDVLAVYDDARAGQLLLQFLSVDGPAEVQDRAVENLRRHLPTRWRSLRESGEVDATIRRLLEHPSSRSRGLQLIAAVQALSHVGAVVTLVQDDTTPPSLRQEAIRTLGALPTDPSVAALIAVARPGHPLATDAIQALGQLLPSGPQSPPYSQKALTHLQHLLLQPQVPEPLRRLTLRNLAGNRLGTVWLLDLHHQKKLPQELVAEAGQLLRNSPFQGERNRALLLFPPPAKLNPKNLPPISTLVQRSGDPARGKLVWNASLTGAAQCAKCHSIRGVGGQVGPDLSMIGKKASRENLYESILFPSRAIADQYVQYQVTTNAEVTISGLLIANTPEYLILRDANGQDVKIAKKEIDGPIRKLPVSLMPEDIVAALTDEELVDLVAYLETLKTPVLTPTVAFVAGPFYPASSMKEALDKEFGPERTPFTLRQAFGSVTWQRVTSDARGYFDLAALHGKHARQSASYLYWEVDSPRQQSAQILLGSDDGARLWLNGQEVFRTEATRAAAPEQDRIAVTLQKGKNTLLLKVANGDGPHGAYLTLLAEDELRLLQPTTNP